MWIVFYIATIASLSALGLALLLQGNRSSVIFPHHSALRFKRSPSPADRTDSLCRIVIDHAVFFPASEPQCSSRKGSRLTQAERWTPQLQHGRFIPRQSVVFSNWS